MDQGKYLSVDVVAAPCILISRLLFDLVELAMLRAFRTIKLKTEGFPISSVYAGFSVFACRTGTTPLARHFYAFSPFRINNLKCRFGNPSVLLPRSGRFLASPRSA